MGESTILLVAADGSGMVQVTGLDSSWKGLSLERFGRNIPHVLLLHASALNADGIEDAVRLLRERSYEFASLGSVLTDEAYSSPDHYIGERG